MPYRTSFSCTRRGPTGPVGVPLSSSGYGCPNVVGLVYIAGFGLDEGESIGALLAQGPPSPAIAHLIIDEQGFAWLPEDDFVHHFAADVDPVKARVIYAVQQPLSTGALQEVMGVPAWKSLPSWYMVAPGALRPRESARPRISPAAIEAGRSGPARCCRSGSWRRSCRR
jgi:hypothetical protein